MNVYVARQPIFDRNMEIYGYELLYRRSSNNYFEATDDNQATADLIKNAFLVMHLDDLTGKTKAFINFSEELLIEEIPLLLPNEDVVIEVLERVRPTETVIHACKKLKREGYLIALDDFVFDEAYLPLIEIADIIKVEFPAVTAEKQRQMITYYKNRGTIKFLAEKIETREDYQTALELGYDLFQGYFFSKPVIVEEKDVSGLDTSLVQIIEELNKEEPDFQNITEVIEKDLGLTYKVLKVANSVGAGSRTKIYSIKQALTRFGISEMKKWMYLLMFQDKKNVENSELIKLSLTRGKFMESLAIELGLKQRHLEAFLTGIFSSIDILLHREMKDIVQELPLTPDVKEALLGEENELTQLLHIAINFEKADWKLLENNRLFIKLDREKIMLSYIDSLKWVMELNY